MLPIHLPWPIFGGVSIEAAKAALASAWQGRFPAMHKALFGVARSLDTDTIQQVAAANNVDVGRLRSDLKDRDGDLTAILSRVDAFARNRGFHATPSLLVADEPVPGDLSYDDLISLVQSARKPAKKT